MPPQSVEGFLEESVVRRELSDNYCYYNQQYDDISTSYAWVTETLQVTIMAPLRSSLWVHEATPCRAPQLPGLVSSP